MEADVGRELHAREEEGVHRGPFLPDSAAALSACAARSGCVLPRILGHADQHAADQRGITVEHGLRSGGRTTCAAVAQALLRLCHQLLDGHAGLRTGGRAFAPACGLEHAGPGALAPAIGAGGPAALGTAARSMSSIFSTSASAFFICVSCRLQALIDELLQGVAVGLDRLHPRAPSMPAKGGL